MKGKDEKWRRRDQYTNVAKILDCGINSFCVIYMNSVSKLIHTHICIYIGLFKTFYSKGLFKTLSTEYSNCIYGIVSLSI